MKQDKFTKIAVDLMLDTRELVNWGIETGNTTPEKVTLSVTERRETAIKLIESGVSQRQAAKLLGVSKGTIQNDLDRNCPLSGQKLSTPREEMRARDEARVAKLRPRKGKYRTLVVDPPWDYDWLSIAGRAKPGYATMTRDQLVDLNVQQWAHEECHLYLWTTNNFMGRACELMDAWGFQHKTVLTWVKPRWGLGSYFRNQTEHVLFGVKGGLRTRSDSISTVIEAPMGEHSEKPDAFYDLVAQASHLPAGELFQRKPRKGFVNVFVSGGGNGRDTDGETVSGEMVVRPTA